MSTNNNNNDRYFDDSKNKGDGRKILQAKRHGSSRLNRYNQPTTSYHASTSQGVKRTQSTDNADQPPSKKLYVDYTPQRMSYAPVPHSAKNLASRRMENLRKSLEQQRKDGLKKTPDSSMKSTPNKLPKTPVSNVNERLKQSGSRYSSTPNYKSDGHFKRSSKRDSDDETSPDSSPAKSSSVQDRLKSCKSFERCSFKSNPSSKFVQSPVCSTTSYSDMHRRDQETSVDSSVLNNAQHSSSPVKLYSQTSTDSDSMEWSAIDEETILENINELRKEINYKLPVNNIPNNCNMLTSVPQNGSAHIVVDTNIFLSQLSFVSRLRDTNFTGCGRPVIVVPWMVIQELDYMKESNHHRSLSKTAQKAVHYINGQLASKHPQFKGQTVLEASTQDLSSINPDDGILFCCLQLVQQGKKVILLSNDVNLRSKALVNNVPAYSNNDIINNLNNMNTSAEHTANDTRPVQKIKILISNLLTYIIENEMKDAFGDLWLRMAMMHPPFTTEEALICMDKYWISVFSFSLQKQCKQKIEEFIVFMKNHRYGDNYQTADFIKFVEYSLSLCIYLKNGYKKYKEKVTECIFNIQKCAE